MRCHVICIDPSLLRLVFPVQPKKNKMRQNAESAAPFSSWSRVMTLVAGLQLLAGGASFSQAAGPAVAKSTLINAGFEQSAAGSAPSDWVVPPVPGYLVTTTDQGSFEGAHCATVSCDVETGGPFGNLIQRVEAAPFRGQRVRFRAAVRTEVKGPRNQAQLWLRVDRTTASGERAMGAFDNMGNRPITAAAWAHYEIVGDVAEDAERITMGMMFLGKGRAWLDDASLEVVGPDVPLTTKSPLGAGRSGTPLANLKPGLFEIAGAMRITPVVDPTAEPKANDGDQTELRRQIVLIPLPLVYRDQAPLNYELAITPRADVEAVDVYKDNSQNFVLRVALAGGRRGTVDINFRSTVLVGPSDFTRAPAAAPLPESWPEEARPWLAATWCADSQNERIEGMAAKIRAETSDVPDIIRRVERATATVFRTSQGRVTSLTAVEALDKQGSCTSCANLVAAVLRACGVPARIVAGYPSWSGPLQTHYIVEAYVPDCGWYPIESTMSQSPWPNSHQVQVAIIPPAYEAESKAGARVGIAGGVPYLSLTELPGNDGSCFAVGTIDGAAGCDHECRMVRNLTGESDDWNRATRAAASRWQAWLDSAHELDGDGRMRFGPGAQELSAESVDVILESIASRP